MKPRYKSSDILVLDDGEFFAIGEVIDVRGPNYLLKDPDLVSFGGMVVLEVAVTDKDPEISKIGVV